MIKRTLYFGNPAYLSLSNGQMLVRLPGVEKNPGLPEGIKKDASASIPVEDIGVVVLDDKQITLTHALLDALISNNVAVIPCHANHMPGGLFLPTDANSVFNERLRQQLEAGLPLKKQLWQQTVAAKLRNQAGLLRANGMDASLLMKWSREVRSGDPDNYEAQAAAVYWRDLFPYSMQFRRQREGPPPNNLLNYGYALLRAVTARALMGSGMLPVAGIHHQNKYNPFCLADDIMEPYRPYVDSLVCSMLKQWDDVSELTKELKAGLLKIPVLDVNLNGENSPLMVAMQRTTASLYRCYEGSAKKILYPEM